MNTFLTIIHIIVCVFLILVVLLQAGKGGGMGIAFGGVGSQMVFGSSGAGNFLTKLTSATATIFLLTSSSLSRNAESRAASGSPLGSLPLRSAVPFCAASMRSTSALMSPNSATTLSCAS